MPVFRRNIPCACWCLVVAASLAAPVVRADALDAKDLFAQARGLRLQGQCASALPLFRRAYDVYPAGLGSLRNIAECEEELGHFASARRAWLDLQRALSTNSQARYEGWEQDAALAAARLAPKVATLTIEVHAVTESGKPAQATGIHVSVNGEALTPDRRRHAARPRSRDNTSSGPRARRRVLHNSASSISPRARESRWCWRWSCRPRRIGTRRRRGRPRRRPRLGSQWVSERRASSARASPRSSANRRSRI